VTLSFSLSTNYYRPNFPVNTRERERERESNEKKEADNDDDHEGDHSRVHSLEWKYHPREMPFFLF